MLWPKPSRQPLVNKVPNSLSPMSRRRRVILIAIILGVPWPWNNWMHLSVWPFILILSTVRRDRHALAPGSPRAGFVCFIISGGFAVCILVAAPQTALDRGTLEQHN